MIKTKKNRHKFRWKTRKVWTKNALIITILYRLLIVTLARYSRVLDSCVSSLKKQQQQIPTSTDGVRMEPGGGWRVLG